MLVTGFIQAMCFGLFIALVGATVIIDLHRQVKYPGKSLRLPGFFSGRSLLALAVTWVRRQLISTLCRGLSNAMQHFIHSLLALAVIWVRRQLNFIVCKGLSETLQHFIHSSQLFCAAFLPAGAENAVQAYTDYSRIAAVGQSGSWSLSWYPTLWL